jgi:hypothetical protein
MFARANDGGTGRHDLTGDVASRNDGKLKSQHSLQISPAYLPIDWIYTCCRDLHKDPPRSSRRHRHISVPELIYTSVPMHLYGFKVATSVSMKNESANRR